MCGEGVRGQLSAIRGVINATDFVCNRKMPMGLTISYKFKADPCDEERARSLVHKLRRRALDLPFLEVGEVREFGEGEVHIKKLPRNSPDGWLFIQSELYYDLKGDEKVTYLLHPLKLIVFSTHPGAGAEQANFGLAVYHDRVTLWDRSTSPPTGTLVPTHIGDWYWESFCKTQFAIDERHGGLTNFLRTHMTIVKLLDYARELGILVEVNDGGGYWESRDIEKLANEARTLNSFIGGSGRKFVSQIIERIVKEHPELGPPGPIKEIDRDLR